MSPTPSDVTRLLQELSGGDGRALDRLVPLVYEELREVARQQLRRERAGHTLDSVALVHEAYVKLVGQEGMEWQSRAHFFGIAARAMRAILVDHARAHTAAKRGGGQRPVPIDEVAELLPDPQAEHLLALDEALHGLASIDEEAGRVVEYRYFAGLTLEEIAAVLGVSVATVRRRWDFAKAWLRRELTRDP